MEERVTTSFIPKMPLAVEARHRTGGSPMAFANLVAMTILILAIIGAGGVFFFDQYTQSQIKAKQASLSTSREAFEPATIEQLSRLNTRIEAGKQLLAQHMAVSKLFDELENLTLSSLRYNKFDYSVASAGHVVLTMSGEATSFNAVALQSEAFSKSAIVTDPIFSNVNVGTTGKITFDFTGVIDSSRLGYAAAPSAPATATTSASTFPPQP